MPKIDEMFQEFYMEMEGENSGNFAVVARELFKDIEPVLYSLHPSIQEEVAEKIMSAFRRVAF